MKKQKTCLKGLIILGGVIIIAGFFLHYVLCLIIPPKAAERAAITAAGENTAYIDGFDIWYRIYNKDSDKTPIIVAAGGCGLSSDYMEDSMSFLADTHPLLFYDTRGCGRSQIRQELTNYSIGIFADEIESIRKAFFKDKDVIVLAHSFGGIIAMKYAVSHPDTLEKLILVSSVSADYKSVINGSYFKTGLPPRDQSAANVWYMQNINVFLEPYFQNAAAKSILSNTLASYAVMMRVGRASLDLSAELHNVKAPVLILAGGKKEYPLTGIGVARKLKGLFPNATMRRFKNSGHFLFAEENSKFRSLVNDFLRDG